MTADFLVFYLTPLSNLGANISGRGASKNCRYLSSAFEDLCWALRAAVTGSHQSPMNRRDRQAASVAVNRDSVRAHLQGAVLRASAFGSTIWISISYMNFLWYSSH